MNVTLKHSETPVVARDVNFLLSGKAEPGVYRASCDSRDVLVFKVSPLGRSLALVTNGKSELFPLPSHWQGTFTKIADHFTLTLEV